MVGNIREYITTVLVSISVLIPLLLYALPVTADRYSSSSYKIDASTMNNFGGSGTSSSYKLVSSGGEAVIGNGTSGSYKLAQGYVSQLQGQVQSLELAVQPSGLVAYWPLDEASGTVAHDASANTHDGTVINGAGTVWATGKIGNGLDLNSVQSQYVNVPGSTDFSPGSHMTISMWANQFSVSSDSALLSYWDYSALQGSWAIQTDGTSANRLQIFIASSVGDVGNNYVNSATGSWIIGAWNHVVIVYDGSLANTSRVKIYINGVSSTTTTTGTIATSLANPTAPLTISNFVGLNRYWNGGIDNLKIFNRSFRADEVTAEYKAGNAGYPSGLSLNTITPGASQTATFDAITKASTTSYSLAINQGSNLTNGAATIPAVSGSIASPVAWSEGTTKGLGFTLVSGTGIPGLWNSGNSYAALPGSATTFYTRSGATANTKDVLGLRLRLDVTAAQIIGGYNNLMTITGTTIP